MLTAAVNGPTTKAEVLATVRAFETFDGDNDPHHEHDVAFFELKGERCFFKIDYYDKSMELGRKFVYAFGGMIREVGQHVGGKYADHVLFRRKNHRSALNMSRRSVLFADPTTNSIGFA